MRATEIRVFGISFHDSPDWPSQEADALKLLEDKVRTLNVTRHLPPDYTDEVGCTVGPMGCLPLVRHLRTYDARKDMPWHRLEVLLEVTE